MQLTDFAREVPEEVWQLFEPLRLPVAGVARPPPASNRECLHGLFYM